MRQCLWASFNIALMIKVGSLFRLNSANLSDPLSLSHEVWTSVFSCTPWRSGGHGTETESTAADEIRRTCVYPVFFSGATECELDKQGRVNLPGNLREYAKLDKDCVVLGVSNRVEIWSKGIWESYFNQSEEAFNDIAEKLVDFNFDL